MNQLKPNHQIFVEAYLANGNNATQAYLEAYPDVTTGTAGANGYKLLKSTQIQQLIKEKTQERVQNSFWTRENVLREYERLYELALKQKELNNASKALAEGAKLAGLHDQSDTPMQQYNHFINNLVLQIKDSKDDSVEVRAIEQDSQCAIDQ